MGQIQNMCGQDILNKIMKQYGNDALKFITAQKSKMFIQDKFTELSRKFHQSFQQFQTNIKLLTQGKSTQITKAFQGLKNKANSVLPGGIATLQRVKGKNVNQISGFNNLIQQVQAIKGQALNNLSVKKAHMMGKLQEQKGNMTQKIDKQKPNIPLYDQLPAPLKTQLFKQAEKKFSKQLAKDEEQLDKKIMGLFNASALSKMFQEMSPQVILDKILHNGFGNLQKNIFSNIGSGFTNQISGGGIGNAINSFIR